MTIAVIGWGSLIWDPDDLAVHEPWHHDGPILPVEFARCSSRDRLTLVLNEGAPVQPTLWAVSRKATLEEAVENLRIREGTGSKGIGRWARADGLTVNASAEIVAEWAESRRVDGAVWTALGPTDIKRKPGWMSVAERLEYLRGLVAEGKEGNAREYIEKAPAQIETLFRALVRRELGWGKK